MVAHSVSAADAAALDRLIGCVPRWVDQTTAGQASGCDREVLLHAGPAFSDVRAISRPVLNSARVAAVYEGLADDFKTAEAAILHGDIQLKPAQDYRIATPLASVVSMSMPVHEVRDGNQLETVAFAPINGGSGPAIRLGMCSEAVLSHLRWVNGPFARQLSPALETPIDLTDIARRSLGEGDDCHGRTVGATRILSAHLEASLDTQGRHFFSQGPSFFLNVWMAAVRCMFNAADGVEGSSLVTAAGANGVETGIRVSGVPDRWFTAPAGVPDGGLDVDVPLDRRLGAIGDSAIVDAFGLGAMAMNFAPLQQRGLGPYMPEGGLALPQTLLSAVHPAFGDLDVRVGLLARCVIETDQQPVVSLGVLDRSGELGRLGGGIFAQPIGLFQQVVKALDALC